MSTDGKLTIRGSWYLDGSVYVVVVTGHPQDAVRIGTGSTVAEAWEALEITALQSVGRDSGEAAALRWAHGAGWISAATTRPEWTDDGDLQVLLPTAFEGASGAVEEAALEALKDWLDSQDWLEPADEEAAASVDEPVGDVDWSDETYAYVACVYGADGDEPGDCYVRVGEDDVGLWWLDDGDDDERPDRQGPWNTEEEAREAAEAFAAEQHEGEEGETADEMRERVLRQRAGEPDPKGAWCVYYCHPDGSHVEERYATRDAAEAAAETAQTALEELYPGGRLLCGYEVRVLIDGRWVTPDEARAEYDV